MNKTWLYPLIVILLVLAGVSVSIYYGNVSITSKPMTANVTITDVPKDDSNKYDKMSASLSSHLQSMKPNDTVEIWIWLTPINESLVPPRPNNDEEAVQRTEVLKTLFAEKEKSVIAWLESKGLKVTYASRYAPLVFANLPKQYILEIQQLADVAWLEMTGKLELAG
ncbi:MAG TPA: hypothetical protein VIH27_02765 [Nitrososphaerales archaeon]